MIRKIFSKIRKVGSNVTRAIRGERSEAAGKKLPSSSRQAGARASGSSGARLCASKHGLNVDAIPSSCRRVVETLQGQGYQAYVVGGAVRDLLLGRRPKDFDVATDATPEDVKRCFRRAHIIGRRFRIVHVHMGGDMIEVTTFRGGDERTHKDERGRILHDNVFGSMSEDASRRDFTVNALYYDPTADSIVDYHHGVADLEQKTLRVIGEPRLRYREDPVRMLRAVRLAAKLGLSIAPEARRPIREMGSLIEHVPPARLFDEMLKLLTSGHAVRCLLQLRDEGLHHGLLPLLDVILEQPKGERFVMLALGRTDERVLAGKPISPSFLFATLLWHEVLVQWDKHRADLGLIPGLYAAMDEVLDVQAEKLAITRRIAGDIKEIWSLQPRFENRLGKRSYALLENPRFRAGYDFLVLRADSGEIASDLAEWWTRFQEESGEGRAAMVADIAQDKTSVGEKKRRRRTRRRSTKSSSGETSGPSVSGVSE